jgi:hypothetical protein
MRIACLFASLLAVGISVCGSAASAHPDPWQACARLVKADEKNCGTQTGAKAEIETIDQSVKFRIGGGRTDEYLMRGTLNPNGSGKVPAISPRNRPVTLDVAPGQGPRTIFFSPPFSICTRTWNPI